MDSKCVYSISFFHSIWPLVFGAMAMSIADFTVCESFLSDFKLLTDHFQEDELLMLCDIIWKFLDTAGT